MRTDSPERPLPSRGASRRVTRLAPSPTGALHLGNARTFLITWAMARGRGWDLLLRIEDLDTPRVKAGAAESLAETLRWLGMDWDAPRHGPLENPLVQSHDLEPYRDAMRRLAHLGHAYPCTLSRKQIEQAASAPQEGSHDVAFPPGLRPPEAGRELDFDAIQRQAGERGEASANWRFVCPSVDVNFTDGFAGQQRFSPASIVGDFVLWTKRDQPSYQLAVVVDDARQGVTDVVRGDDLLDSAARQLLLYRALKLRDEPAHWHVPLVLGLDGKRLAKRHGDTRVDMYRARGVSPERVIGLLTSWSISGCARRPMTVHDAVGCFDAATLPRTPVVFTPEDDRWLLSNEP